MVRREVLERKAAHAAARLNDAEAILSLSREQFAAERTARDLASFYLLLAIQDCIDIAAHWVADAGWPPPAEAGGAFDVLAERGVIPADLSSPMRAAIGLRHRIAHGYAAIDHERLHAEARVGLTTLRRFLSATAASGTEASSPF